MLAWIQWTPLRCGVFLLGLGLFGLCAIPAATSEDTGPSLNRNEERDANDEQDEHRIREGATLEAKLGEFREAGERIRFYPHDEKVSFVAIENLALERVSLVLDDTSGRTWRVSGVVTEYRGGNYLIVTRAALKTLGKRAKSTPRN